MSAPSFDEAPRGKREALHGEAVPTPVGQFRRVMACGAAVAKKRCAVVSAPHAVRDCCERLGCRKNVVLRTGKQVLWMSRGVPAVGYKVLAERNGVPWGGKQVPWHRKSVLCRRNVVPADEKQVPATKKQVPARRNMVLARRAAIAANGCDYAITKEKARQDGAMLVEEHRWKRKGARSLAKHAARLPNTWIGRGDYSHAAQITHTPMVRPNASFIAAATALPTTAPVAARAASREELPPVNSAINAPAKVPIKAPIIEPSTGTGTPTTAPTMPPRIAPQVARDEPPYFLA